MPTLNFKGKTFVQNHHLAVKHHQLIPQKELSQTDTLSLHDNLIIHGDNLAALKSLLPTYAGKIKCIYIDPPYNTGGENWVYNDNVNSPMIKDWLGKIVDREDMTRHDKWLCLMMPRLKLLRELLREDGVIFISIDDNEQHYLRCLLDEIFGESNFVSEIVIQSNKRGQTYKEIAKTHEYLFVYSKSENFCLFELEKDGDSLPYEDSKGKFDLWELRNRNPKFGRFNRPNLYYPIYVSKTLLDENGYSKISLEQNEIFTEIALPKNSSDEDSCWRWSKEKIIKEDTTSQTPILIAKQKKNGDWNIYEKARKSTTKAKSIWDDTSVISEQGTTALGLLDLKNVFDHPKPLGLLNKLLKISSENNDIILDSFAGSGTTAHAVLELNKEDGGNRKFILIEQEDYANTITAERVRRVINGVETAKNETLKNGLGGTFSYFKLGDAIEMESILRGETLPSFVEFARYIFYTATGEEFNEQAINENTGFIGSSKNHDVYMFYKPDIEWLKQNALTLNRVNEMPHKTANKMRLVFAPAKYVDDETCRVNRIDFCQLPYEIYRMV